MTRTKENMSHIGDIEGPPTRKNILRSANMSRIRGANTKPELLLRKALWREGLRYRLHSRIEGVRPDIVFKLQKLAIFVDGCFWHGCPLHYVRPRSKPDFWADKLRSNTMRDQTQTIHLMEKGWTVLRFWEHEVEGDLEQVVSTVLAIRMNPGNKAESRSIITRVEPRADGTEIWTIEDLIKRFVPVYECRRRNLLKL